MSVFNVIQLFGGLAMFLYGMSLMSDKLEKLAGGKLEQIFEKLTSNRFKGLLLGVLVTAVVQSSSATTVMLVGFVNSGIMRLSQAISIIMGANIGTTVTTWLLSLSGLEGDHRHSAVQARKLCSRTRTYRRGHANDYKERQEKGHRRHSRWICPADDRYGHHGQLHGSP